MRRRTLFVFALALVWAPSAFGGTLSGAPKCPVFPASNVWNKRVDSLPVAANSDAIVRAIGVGDYMHADFGSGKWDGGPIGIPITVVRGSLKTLARALRVRGRVATAARIRSRQACGSRAARRPTATATR